MTGYDIRPANGDDLPRIRQLVRDYVEWIALDLAFQEIFVHPSARGHGLARALIVRLLDEARALGYCEMRLDTLPMMGGAQALYTAMGFVDIPPYCETPIAGTRFMALRL